MKKYFLLLLLLLSSLSLAAPAELIVEPEDGQKPVLNALQEAHSTIDLAIYGFTDPVLLEAFIQAKQEGKKVRIMLQHFPYKAANENLPAIQRFSASKLNFTYAPPTFYLLHQKTLILDHKRAFVLTFNFTRSTFKNQRNFGLIISDPVLVKEIQTVFDADWQQKKTNPVQNDLVWSPDNSRAKILNLIANAKKEIKVYAQGLNDYQVIGALAKAAKQGVKVEVLTSGSLSKGKEEYLERAGVRFREDKKLMIHAKVLMVDQERALLGSINFTQTSINRNRELGVLIKEPAVMKRLLEVFQKDWDSSVSRKTELPAGSSV